MKYNKIDILSLSIIFIATYMYVWTVLTYASTMPISDDYGAVLLFLNNYVLSDDLFECFKMLFDQHNEHRIVFNRMIEILQFKLTGEVNFVILILLGNLGWISLVWFLWKYLSSKKIVTVVSFVPVVLIMFTFSHAALMTWAMASLQNYWQLFFVVIALYYMTIDKPYKTLFFMMASFFTGGGGILVIPFVLFYYVLHKKWKHLVLGTLFSSLLFIVYFIFFEYHEKISNRDYYAIIIEHYDRFLSYFLCYIGNVGDTPFVAKIIAITSLVLFFYKVKQLYIKEPLIFWIMLFVGATAVLAALFRSHLGDHQAMSSRYGIYSILFLALLYIQYNIVYKNNKIIITTGVVFGLLLYSYYLFSTPDDFEKRKRISETILDHPAYTHAEKILKASKKIGVFSANIKLPSTLLNAKRKDGKAKYTIHINNHTVLTDTNTSYTKPINIDISATTLNVKVDGWVYDAINQTSACAVLSLFNGKKKVLYLRRNDNDKNDLGDYFNASFDFSRLQSGKHHIELRILDSQCTRYYETVNIIFHKESIESLLKLPVKKGALRGWIDKFEVIDNKVTIIGWYAQLGKPILSKIVFLDIDGVKYITKYGYDSLGVSEVLGTDAYAKAGFKLVINKEKIGKGIHKIKAYVLSDNLENLIKADKTFEFEVK